MQETRILSTHPAPLHEPAPRVAAMGRALVFDACQVGVVLHAVLFVEVVLGVCALFGTTGPGDWLARLALLTGAALPATLLWLVTACSLKNALQRLPPPLQYAAGVLLGMLAGLYACAMLLLAGAAGEAPPWLACAASGALLSALLVTALQLRARARTPAATAARLTELQSRIRPHFLFNTLNSAIALVRDEPAKAEALLEDLSDLFRHALVEQGESATLEEEITLARRYLDIEQVRFGERMRVQWQIDPRAHAARLPPLLLQPLVENAVKHGVEPSAHGGKLRITAEQRGSRVVLTITNTLPPESTSGEQRPRGHGIAQANVRERLRLLHDVDCDFSAGMHNGLYQVRISLPC
ncbi:MAG TPA: histidine kinase [Alicycliphilus sp.]|nr:histidine kinase [Alicycliphilus sp.]